ncbi:CPBP family intramembrane glutamic endopeptidase [Roseibium sp.]|uniref:CPBP family intramembrane glutamic endopeptidase n=1 Tax=Roseibium sp. TaxID=1936156 RepID=UPI003A97DCE6
MLAFLALTFAISLTGFVLIVAVPGARNPESLRGLPYWLLMVWGPSLAAIILAFQNGHLSDFLSRVVMVPPVAGSVWALVLAPVLLLLLLRPIAPDAPEPVGVSILVAMAGFNLVLGPLGEELGWRGVFQEDLQQTMGWLETSIVTGLVWTVWHLPLWTIETPHSKIALPLFAAHCMLYSIIIGAAYTLSGGSLLPAILLHLTVNLASNYAIFAGFRDPNAWFRTSLLPYVGLALGAIGLVFVETGKLGLRAQ